MFYSGPEIIVSPITPMAHPALSGGMRGLVPRTAAQPVGYSTNIPPAKIKVYSRQELVDLIADRDKFKSRLSDILRRSGLKSLNQNGQGYCWMYGPVGALMTSIVKANQPAVRLSAHAAACKVKGFRDQGGWGAEGLEFLVANGCPDVDHWKEQSMSKTYDTPEAWANAKLYMPNGTFADLASPKYDRNMSYGQQLTVLADLNPTADDYDYWSHCTNGLDAVNGESHRTTTRVESGKLASLQEFDDIWAMNDPDTQGLGKRSRNSWGDSYGDQGFFISTGAKAVSSNCVAIMDAIA